MEAWSVPPLWLGETVAVIAPGPSANVAVCNLLVHMPAIVINDAFRLAPWADMLYAADVKWWEVNEEARRFDGLKVTCSYQFQWPEILCLRQSGPSGFDPDPTAVRTGGNSGYQAIHVAIHAKAKRILLFGFDMHGDHFFGRHPAPLRNSEPEHYLKWIPLFAALNGRGSEIINCTPGSALTCFPTDTLWQT
jgi:hypothetical protein